MIGRRRVAWAFLARTPLLLPPFEVELRGLEPATDPRSQRPVPTPPLTILWWQERPFAVRVRDVVAICEPPPDAGLAAALEEAVEASGLAIERTTETVLWRLFLHPSPP
jgi:hypothetical protein